MTQQKPSTTKAKKFKTIEKDKEKDALIEWTGEEVQAQSDTKLEEDVGLGQAVVLRFFDFGADPEKFQQYKPTAQDLFNSHLKGIESLLWRDGLKPFGEIEPRILFSVNGKDYESYSPIGKQYTHYRIIVGCLNNQVLVDEPKTLSQLLTNETARHSH